MQEICSSNPPVVAGICDPNKSQAQHHCSLKNWFLQFFELYISGSPSSRKIIFNRLKILLVGYWKKENLIFQSISESIMADKKRKKMLLEMSVIFEYLLI